MARYDDYRVTFTTRPDGSYGVAALDADGATRTGTFRVPFGDDELARLVSRTVAHARSAPAPTTVTRDIGGAEPPRFDAERVGAALAGALLTGPIGEGYAAARSAAEAAGRGIRLSLSLAEAPALLSLPWELLYQRPRFLASQRKSPVVRMLERGALTAPPVIDSTVRILGIVANPRDLAPLDVARERAGVETAIARTLALGRVELDWLEPATPRRLREALRDGSYHVLHYVGHSSFTPAGDGAVYLEADDGTSHVVDETLLANLLADQDLRLVVLNSCEGARTTATDPYAGVATTLVALGVPAVVAMQFEISDRAAIVFAEELYLNLIGRQAPIDAAIAEARKAVYTEVSDVEWATPVLFVRDPDVELFRFAVDAPLTPVPVADDEPDAAPAAPAPPPRRRRMALVGAAAVAAIAAAGIGVALATGGGGDDERSETTTPSASTARSGALAVQIVEEDGDVSLRTLDPATLVGGEATGEAGVQDVEADWDRESDRLAFRRIGPSTACTGLCYVVPPNGTAGRPVTQLVAPPAGAVFHAPSWGPDDTLAYAVTAGCDPGPGCAEEIQLVAFEVVADDTLTVVESGVVVSGLNDIRDIAADYLADAAVFATGEGVFSVDADRDITPLGTSISDVSAVTFTGDDALIVALGTFDGASTIEIWDRQEAGGMSTANLDSMAQELEDSGGDLGGLAPADIVIRSITRGVSGRTVDVVLDDDDEATSPLIATIEIDAEGGTTFVETNAFPLSIRNVGVPVAVSR